MPSYSEAIQEWTLPGAAATPLVSIQAIPLGKTIYNQQLRAITQPDKRVALPHTPRHYIVTKKDGSHELDGLVSELLDRAPQLLPRFIASVAVKHIWGAQKKSLGSLGLPEESSEDVRKVLSAYVNLKPSRQPKK